MSNLNVMKSLHLSSPSITCLIVHNTMYYMWQINLFSFREQIMWYYLENVYLMYLKFASPHHQNRWEEDDYDILPFSCLSSLFLISISPN